MISRIKKGLSKLIFCWFITADLSSFLLLIWSTKKYKWNRKKIIAEKKFINDPVKYKMRFGKKNLDIYLRTYSGDIEIFYEIFWKKAYDFKLKKDAEIIIDLGANIGLASLYFLQKFPKSKIFAVEPDATNINILKMNLHKEIFDKKIIVLEAAVSNKNDIAFFRSSSLKYNSKISVEKDNGQKKVDVISMPGILKKFSLTNVDLLKIDIEGDEEKVFSGDIGWVDNMQQIIMEVHSVKAFKACLNALNPKNFILQNENKKLPGIFYLIKKQELL